MPMPPAIRPNGNPARILEKRISKKSRRRIKLVTNEWSNFHRGVGSSLKMHWRRQGDLGELSAMEWFESQGAIVCFPIGHSPDWDFIAELNATRTNRDRPASLVEGDARLYLRAQHPTYAEFEVDPGRPLLTPTVEERPSRIAS
jgi:hypothetical protein